MVLLQKDIDSKSLDHPDPAKNQKSEEVRPGLTEAESQDEQLWESTYAASQDTLAHLAARSREHRKAGRTKKIGT